MKSFFLFALFFSFTSALLGGCSKKNADTQLQRAVAAMAQPEPAQTPTTPEPMPQTPSQPAPQTSASPRTQAQEMKQAMAAYKAGDLDDAVIRLQKLRASPVMSPEKRVAVNDAIAAVMGEIYALAQKGDARAIQALKTYEQMQTRPR